MTMEITINIKLEDQDISILIKALFEVFKRIPQDNININIDPQTTTIPPLTENDINNTGTVSVNTDYQVTNNAKSEEVFYSNGSTVKKIEEKQKKNEED